MLLQVSSQLDLSAVLADCSIIHQEQMRMEVVENVEFAEWVQQGLIGSDYLQRDITRTGDHKLGEEVEEVSK